MIVDGRELAQEVLREVRNRISHLDVKPHVTVITSTPNFETKTYLNLKQQKATEAGIGMSIVELPGTVPGAGVVQSIRRAAIQSDAIIVQLPLPGHIDTEAVLAAIPPACDADALNPETREVLSPVVAACQMILERARVDVRGKKAVVIGEGRLVGVPVAKWLTDAGAEVTVLTEALRDFHERIREAELVVSGAGVPGLITTEMISERTIILDAGTSESSGKLRGDADPACAEKALVFTPVPGGIGPVTVAMLLKNVVELAEQ